MSSGMLKLPDELLLNIALRVDFTERYAMSLVCHRLRPVALEALVQVAALSPKNIWHLFDMLQMFPGLVTSLSHLSIQTSDTTERAAVIKSGIACSNLLTMRGYKICCEVIEKGNPGADNTEWLEALLKESEQNFISVGLSLLIAHTKKLTTLSVDTRSIGCVPMLAGFFRHGDSEKPFLLPGWAKQVRSLLESRLEVLDVNERTALTVGERRIPLSFARFQQLRRLTVAFTGLSMGMGTATTIPGAPHAVVVSELLPRSLEILQVHIDHSRNTIVSLWWFDGLLKKSDFPLLKHFELCSKYNLLSTAWYICMRGFSEIYRSALTVWHKSSLEILTTFGNKKYMDVIQGVVREQLKEYDRGDLLQALAQCLPCVDSGPSSDSELSKALGFGDILDCVIIGGC